MTVTGRLQFKRFDRDATIRIARIEGEKFSVGKLLMTTPVLMTLLGTGFFIYPLTGNVEMCANGNPFTLKDIVSVLNDNPPIPVDVA